MISQMSYIEYLSNILQACPPSILSQSKLSIFISNISQNQQNQNKIQFLIDNLLEPQKYTKSININQNMPAFYYSNDHNRYVLADFGSMWMRDGESADLCFRYLMEYASELRVFVIVDYERSVGDVGAEELEKSFDCVYQMFGQIQQKYNELISQSISIIVLINQNTLPQPLYTTLQTLIAKHPKNSLLHTLLSQTHTHKKLIFATTYNQLPLKSIPCINLKQNKLKFLNSQKLLQNRLIDYLSQFGENTGNIIVMIAERVESIFSRDKSIRQEMYYEMERKLLRINNRGLRINKHKFSKEKEMVIIMAQIVINLIQFYLRQRQILETGDPIEICLPWEIIKNIYCYKEISQSNFLESCEPYIHGHFCQFLFKAFYFVPKFRIINTSLVPYLYKIILNLLIHLSQTSMATQLLASSLTLHKQFISTVNKFQKIVQLSNSLISLQAFQVVLSASQLQNSITYIQISSFRLKYSYLLRMQTFLTRTQKIQLCSQIHKEYHTIKVPFKSLFQEHDSILRKIYEITGDQFLKIQLYHFAIRCYEAGNLLNKIKSACQTFLKEKLQMINKQNFLKIAKKLVQMGYNEQAREYSYFYIKDLSADQKLHILQFVYDSQQYKIQKLDYMKTLYKQVNGLYEIIEDNEFEMMMKEMLAIIRSQSNLEILLP